MRQSGTFVGVNATEPVDAKECRETCFGTNNEAWSPCAPHGAGAAGAIHLSRPGAGDGRTADAAQHGAADQCTSWAQASWAIGRQATDGEHTCIPNDQAGGNEVKLTQTFQTVQRS
eukprot:g8836.t1